ncbi:MAG TPA: ABC transporter permease [Terracidiphilus sp.]|nr:ABC transporter permease [Terracidiphilus sp.]
MLADLRYALRQLRKSLGFTITAVITLALGIGANTAIFTLVHAVMLRSLPVANPAQLYRIGDNDDCCVEGGFPGDAGDTGDFTIFSYDLYQYLKKQTPEFEQLAATQAGLWDWSVRRGNAVAKSMHGGLVSGNYFTTLGLNAYAGRLFQDSDDTPSASPTVVLSYQAWQGEFASDPSILDSVIYIQARPYTVIGIAPPGFFGDRETDSPPAFWVPLNTEPYLRADSSILHHTASHWLYLLGRVRPGTDVAALQAKIGESLRQWIRSDPVMTLNGAAVLIPKQHVILTPGGGGIQNLQQQTGKGLKLLMILSSVVLLIACANIANLLLARSTARRGDIALRTALGAARGRILRQILTESLVLATIGGAAGLAVAYGGCHIILSLAFPDAKYLPISANPSLAVLGFAFAVSMVTGVLFGIAPAWLSFHAQPAEALRGINRSTQDRSTFPQQALIVFQAALSVVLLAGAVLMSKSLANLEHQSFGVVTTNRYVVHFDPAGAGYSVDRLPALYREIENRFTALPGVTSFSLAMYSPLEGDNWGECAIPQGHPAPRPGQDCSATWDRVTPHFLDSIGVPIVHGRGFTDEDTATSTPVVLVNQTFVKKFFPNEDPVGKHFGIDMPQYAGSWQIVGVFRDFKINRPRSNVHPVYLRPLAQRFMGYKEPDMITTESNSMFMQAMIIGFHAPPADVDALIRHTLAGIDPNLTARDLRSYDAQVAGNFDQDRLIARLTSLFGILALVLASVGLYGVMSYFVARRSSEIGIRMALGATRSSVVAMVLRGALWQILVGLALGIPAALATGYYMASQLYQVPFYDPWALAAAILILNLCAAVAAFIPARRAASIEPMQALRTE